MKIAKLTQISSHKGQDYYVMDVNIFIEEDLLLNILPISRILLHFFVRSEWSELGKFWYSSNIRMITLGLGFCTLQVYFPHLSIGE